MDPAVGDQTLQGESGDLAIGETLRQERRDLALTDTASGVSSTMRLVPVTDSR